MTSGNSTLRRRQLGRRLREAREGARVELAAAARAIGVDRATLSRYEGGTSGIRLVYLAFLARLYGVDDATLTVWEGLARGSRERGWWLGRGLRTGYERLLGLEDAAIRHSVYASVVVPGLLQTEDYAAAVIAATIPSPSPDEIGERVATRVQRQGKLTDPAGPLEVRAVLGEACVRQRIGGVDVWRKQLDRLIELGYGYDNVTLQVLPFSAGAHAGALGGFLTLDFPADEPSVAVVELVAGDHYAEGPELALYAAHFDALRDAAMTPEGTLAMIESLREEADK